MRYVVFLAAIAAQAPANAAAAGADTRAPTLAEQRSFEQFMQRSVPGTPVPPLRLERSRDGKKWIASATTDAPPVRLVLPLCRVTRSRYTQQADDSWRADSSQHVWIHHTTLCGTAPATMVELRAWCKTSDYGEVLNDLLAKAPAALAQASIKGPVKTVYYVERK